MSNLFIFLDESGNLDFSTKGTRHWVLTSLMTEQFDSEIVDFLDLRHQILHRGIDIERFHASEDRQTVRDEVFRRISKLSNVHIDVVIVNKGEVPKASQKPELLYPQIVRELLIHPLAVGHDLKRFENVTIFLDRPSAKRKIREAIVKGIRTSLRRYLRGISHQILLHSSSFHLYLQLVDYCSWAIYVKWERGEARPYDSIKQLIRGEHPPIGIGSVGQQD